MLAIIGSTGKLGTATLRALQTHSLLPIPSLVLCTSSSSGPSPHLSAFVSQGATFRPGTSFDSPASLKAALAGCDKLLLISSPAIALDFHDAPPGEGREKHHVAAIRAAVEAGVRHIFYTSLGFDGRSEAGVMRAHRRTEAFLAEVAAREEPKVKVTVLRVGLYSESWPLYFGYWDVAEKDARTEVMVAGDGKVKWTAIEDLGLATALVLTNGTDRFVGKTVILSAKESYSLSDVAGIVSKIQEKQIKLKVVSREEYCRFYAEKMGRDEAAVEWWSSTYESLSNGDCDNEDGTLVELLATRGVKPKPFEETVNEMLSS